MYDDFLNQLIAIIPPQLSFFPWHDVFTVLFIALGALVVLIILSRLSRRGGGTQAPPVIVALQEVASRENRNKFLDIFEAMYNDVIKKFEEAKTQKTLSPLAINVMSQAFTEYNTMIARVLRPLGATTDELKEQLDELRQNRLQLESEIDQLESKATTRPKPTEGVPTPPQSIPAMGEVDGDALVGAMLKEIKNISEEYGMDDVTSGLDIKDALSELKFDDD